MCEKHCDGCDGNCSCHDENFLKDPAFGGEVDELAKAGWDAVEQKVYVEADLLPSDSSQLNEAVMADWSIMHGFICSAAAAAKISPPRFMKLLDDIMTRGYSPTLVRSFVATLMTAETREILGMYAIDTGLKYLACLLAVDHDIRIEKLPVDKQIKVMAWLPSHVRHGHFDRRLLVFAQYKLFTMLACSQALDMVRKKKKGTETSG
jgi:hypothetical protein